MAWTAGPLGNFITLKRGYDLPEYERLPGTVPVVTSSGISGYHAEAKVKGPGVVMGRYGTLGQVYYVETDFWPHNTALYVRDFKGNDPLFISFLLRTLHFQAYSDKSSVPGLNRNDLHLAHVVLPPLPEQRAIAHILGTLDDKIELNRHMNATLEAMARAIFQSWFVDFDPVRAKAEGRDTGLPEEIAALFPDSFEESALGWIPGGWECGTLADLAALNPENWSRETRPETIHYLDLSNVKWGRIESIVQYAAEDAPSRAQRVLRPGDSVVGTVRPGNGSYTLISIEGLTGSTGFAVLRPHQDRYREFVYLAATRQESISELSHLADGGAYPAVRSEVVAALAVVVPSDEVLTLFSRLVQPMLAKISESEDETRTLSELRDSLLPKLISGEIRVGETKDGIT